MNIRLSLKHLPLRDCLNTMCTYVFKTYPTADITYRFSGLLKKHSQGLSNEVDRILTTDAPNEDQVCDTDIMVYLTPLTLITRQT